MSAGVDISPAIVLARFLRTCRLWVVIAAINFFVGLIMDRENFWWLLLSAAAVVYVVLRFPNRLLLLVWTLILILAALFAGVVCLRYMADILRPDFKAGIILPFTAIFLGFYWLWQGLRKPDLTGGPIAVPTAFAVQPGFIETWLSGGWRSVLIAGALLLGSLILVLPDDRQYEACALLGLALLSATFVRFYLAPALSTLRDNFSLSLLRAIKSNRKRGSRQSYFIFVLRHILQNRKAMGWLLSAPLIVLAYLAFVEVFQRVIAPSGAPPLPASVVIVGVLSVCSFAWRSASRQALRDAAKATDPGSGTFILFLRSFMDDEVTLTRDNPILRLLALSARNYGESADRNPLVIRFEELIAQVVWPFGKMVALGRPGEALPQLGAIRIGADPASWQARIEELISRAQYVLITVGISGGVKWEFQQFETTQNRLKMSVVMLPGEGCVAATWKIFAAQYPQLLAYEDKDLERTIAARFDRNGLPVFIWARGRTAEAYRIAVNMCFLSLENLFELIGTREHRGRGIPAGV